MTQLVNNKIFVSTFFACVYLHDTCICCIMIFMKKIFVYLILCAIVFSIFPLTFSSVCAESFGTVKVITNYADVFDSTQNSANKIFVAKHKDKFELAQNEEIVGESGQTFYKIILDGFENAFIKTHQVLVEGEKNVSNLVTPNAYFKKKVTNADLFIITNSRYEKFCNITTNSSIPIRIIDGYDRHKQYTEIQILIDDEIVNVYVETDKIRPYGIPMWLKVILYVLGSLAVGAIITWVTIHLKRAKKRILD